MFVLDKRRTLKFNCITLNFVTTAKTVFKLLISAFHRCNGNSTNTKNNKGKITDTTKRGKIKSKRAVMMKTTRQPCILTIVQRSFDCDLFSLTVSSL